MPFRQLLNLAFLFLSSIVISSCGIISDDESTYIESVRERTSPTFSGPSEKAYCGTAIPYSSPVTITGNAVYTERIPSGAGLGQETASVINIRHAEVEVINSSGARVQCATIDENGAFSFQVPASTEGLTVRVNSRANNGFAKASVLNKPEQNIHYYIEKLFTPDASKNIGTITASATDEKLTGAAFHILDLIVKTNDFLRAEVGTCSSEIDNCLDFTVANKINIYWEPGFNPNSYFGNPDRGLSFYLPGFSRLFILGGINGDYNSSDTDHFDDTIIIHEYGHFLEDIYSKSDSPGGEHAGRIPIDPRLAFSEAWANFLQAAVNYGSASTDPRYIDTAGNVDGNMTSTFLNVPLEQAPPGCTSVTPGCDQPSEPGEGNYREFAITRTLWDVYDTNNDLESVTGGFSQIWASITDGNGYVNDPDSKYRSVGLMYDIQSNLSLGGTLINSDWSSVFSKNDNLQQNNRNEYAQKVSTGGTCSERNFSITPFNSFSDTAEFFTSNLFKNNDFFLYEQTTSGPITLTLNSLSTGTVEADLDLFIFNESANYNVSFDRIGKASDFKNTPEVDVETETISLSNLPAGHYLINVKVKTHHTTSVGSNTNYEILLGGSRLCP